MNWNIREFWQQNHKYNCPRSRRFQTQVTWIHYKRAHFVFQLQRYNIFKPSLKFADLPAHDRQTVIWLTSNLNDLEWDEGDIPYCDLKTICLSFSFRFIRKNFFAKGIEKCELLSKLLLKTVYNLEDLNCPQISEIISEEQVPSCYLHSNFRSTKDQFSYHCAERKARIFSQWTQNDAQRRHVNFNNLSVRQLEYIHLLDTT